MERDTDMDNKQDIKEVTQEELIEICKKNWKQLVEYEYPHEYNTKMKEAPERIKETYKHIKDRENEVWALLKQHDLALWVQKFICAWILKKSKLNKFRKICGFTKNEYRKLIDDMELK